MAIIRDYPLSAKNEPSHSTKMSTERREEEDRQLILVGWSALPLPPLPLTANGVDAHAGFHALEWFRPFRISPHLSLVSSVRGIMLMT